jgi:HlyD family secretion protein
MSTVNTKRSTRNLVTAGYLSIAVVVGVFGSWSYLARINGAVIAPATLVVESYSKRVQHPEGGIVSRILVKDGDRVEAGQDLLLLDTTETKAELDIMQGMLDEFLIKRARLEAQRDDSDTLAVPPDLKDRATEDSIASILGGQQKLLASANELDRGKMEQLQQQVQQLTEEISGIDGQITSLATQSKLILDELEGLRGLLKQGLVPTTRVLATEREAARLSGSQAELVSSRASAEARVGEVKLRILQIKEDRRTQSLAELRDTEARIAELQEKLVAATARLARTSIKAPITGTIYQLTVHTEGGVVMRGDTLMLIVPEGDDLVLEAKVTPNDIDQVSKGQPAQVRFPAFSSRLTPEVAATVTQVSADVSRLDATSPPFYSVRLVIPATELERLGDQKLKPGMQAEAFIQTEARSPLTYLVKPLWDQIAHTWRET